MKFVLLLVAVSLVQIAYGAGDKQIVDTEVARTNPATGEFSIALTLADLLGSESAQHYTSIFPTDKPIEWNVFIPESYNPKTPAGVLVYISPGRTGSIPNQWKSVMADHNLIWIGANGSGNRVSVARRIVFALTAPAVVDRDYAVDAGRVYIAGFSGGGRAASIASVEYPQIFKGAVFICGADFWGENVSGQLDQVRSNRYVFMSGSGDFNLEPTRKAFSGFRKAGVTNIKLTVIRDMGHKIPKSRDFTKAIAYLDSGEPDK
jgi:pimeloyl-ACP methyl ester carboxylesterase